MTLATNPATDDVEGHGYRIPADAAHAEATGQGRDGDASGRGNTGNAVGGTRHA